jgi:hypothetical protein
MRRRLGVIVDTHVETRNKRAVDQDKCGYRLGGVDRVTAGGS